MGKVLTIKKPYLRVQMGRQATSFGGSQHLFVKEAESDWIARVKKECGCGVVALADLLWYLGLSPREWRYVHRFSKEDYKAYFSDTARRLGGIMPKFGLNILQVLLHFNRIAIGQDSSYRAIWGVNIRKMFPRIRQMLEADIPALICIPNVLGPKYDSFGEKKGLWLYHKNSAGTMSRATKVSAHYVVVTAMIETEDCIWVEVSSWGKRYYFKQTDYIDLLYSLPLGAILGNVLYIRKK